MKEVPKFLRQYSKEAAPEKRKLAAEKIREARRAKQEHSQALADAEQKAAEAQTELPQLEKQMLEREKGIQRILETILQLKNELEENSQTIFGKLDRYFSIAAEQLGSQTKQERLKQSINDLQTTVAELQEEQMSVKDLKRALKQNIEQLEELSTVNKEEPAELLSQFYSEQADIWAEMPYDRQEVESLFATEHLASLDLEGYATLMRRFPSEAVTHVTRQGVRDHTGHVWHTGGYGEFHNGFVDIMRNKKLQSALEITLAEESKNKIVEKYLIREDTSTKEDALAELDRMLDPEEQRRPESLFDLQTVHVATEEVADMYYGAEHANEIFFVFPSMHVASQYLFSGQLNKPGGDIYNDQWIFSDENREGLDVNAAIVFIPSETPVDRKTGSRYELGPDKKPITNTEHVNTLISLIDDPEFKKMLDTYKHAYFSKDKELTKKVSQSIQELCEKYGQYDEIIEHALEDFYRLGSAINQNKERQVQLIHKILSERGDLFQSASETIPAKEYWEQYFQQNPDSRPSKVVWYQGSDPTKALNNWREERGLVKKHKDLHMGFSDRQVESGDDRMLSGNERFRSIAEDIIRKHFEPNSAKEAA